MKKIFFAFLVLLVMSSAAHAGEYLVGEGDALSVHVWGEEDLKSTVVVRPDGKISMPGIEELQAAGLTLPQLKIRMTERLSQLIRNPIVTISLLKTVNSRVFVVGGGVTPQVYDMVQRTTLLHVLASIGSLANADLAKAYVYRDGKKVMVDFEGLYSRGEFEKDIQLKPRDTIFLPVKYDRNVFVIGAVSQPTAILFREGLTVLDALLQAGDFNRYADKDELTIVRKNNGKQETIVVHTKALIKKGDLDQNIMLQAGDYLIARESFF